eukprot:1775782-Prymnesium_polylepis.1
MFMVDDPPTRCKLLAVGSDNTLETYYVDQDEMEHEEDAPAGKPGLARSGRAEARATYSSSSSRRGSIALPVWAASRNGSARGTCKASVGARRRQRRSGDGWRRRPCSSGGGWRRRPRSSGGS